MKKINLFILALFLLIPINVKAIETYDRNIENNYGVNKKWNINDTNLNNVLNTYSVDASEKIYDFSDVLTDTEEILLKQKIDEFINKYNVDLVIFIDDLDKYSADDNEEYAVDFYDYNDFGIDFDKYSGILFWRNTSLIPNYKYYEFYTFGNAQLYFVKSRYDNILDEIYYDISNENYYKAFSKFIDMVDNYFEKGIPNDMSGYQVDDDGYLQKLYQVPWVSAIFISFIVTGIIIIVLVRKNKMVFKKSDANEYLDNSSIVYRNRKDNFIRTYTRTYVDSSSGSGSSGGSHSRSGSSGGGHSSSGGRRG